jgi:cytidylate kinase
MSPPRNIVIAIDGPSGAGKSTVARLLAARLGCLFLDTGALYRAVAYEAGRQGISHTDGPGVARLLPRLQIRFSENGERVYSKLDNGREEDVSAAIRTPEVTQSVSSIAAMPAVRAMLTAQQQAIANGRSVVAEGRDTTTVVFPNADRKFFLTASLEERARRRQAERPELRNATLTDVIVDIERRDALDSSRAVAPLREAPGSIHVDTTGQTLDEVVDHLAARCADLFR